MAKSAKEAAWLPSLPMMPIPTCAFSIMLTSFAPSPIAKVIFDLSESRANLTMSAFYAGEDLYTTKPSALLKASIYLFLPGGPYYKI